MNSNFFNKEIRNWRQTLHRTPEFGFKTKKTAAFVVEKLKSFGITDISINIGGEGVVATLRNGSSNKAIAIRADMDALMICLLYTSPSPRD